MTDLTVTLRPGRPEDADALGAVMFTAIRSGHSPYSDAQRAAWLPTPNSGDAWRARLGGQDVIVAEDKAGPVGFMTLSPAGYIDLAYILPPARGRGVFDRMLHRIEADAKTAGLRRITTHASLMAEPAFSRHGYRIVQRETVIRDGQSLDRAKMSKRLEET